MFITLLIIFSILIFVGVASFLLMIFPAHLFIILVALGFGFIDRFNHLSVGEWLILLALTIVMVVIDYLGGLFGAKKAGASKRSLLLGLIGLVIGLFLLPPFGSLIGLFLGVLIGELSEFKSSKNAVKAATGSVIGSLISVLINILLGFLFLGLFIYFALK